MMTLIPKPPGSHVVIEFSQEDHDNIVNAFKKTLIMSNVAGICKRHVQTIKKWLAWGEADMLEHKETPFSKLYISVQYEKARRVVELEQDLLTTREGWQRFAWILERCVRRDYSVYGEIWDDFERKINDIILKQLERDKPEARKASIEMREWMKERLTQGNTKYLDKLGAVNHGTEKMDTERYREAGSPTSGTRGADGEKDPSKETESSS